MRVGGGVQTRTGWLAIATLAAACYQGLDDGGRQIGPDPGDAGDDDGADDGDSEPLTCAPGWVGLRRLSKREYANTLRDLLGTDPILVDALPQDPSKGGFDNNASALGITPELYEFYLD